MSHIHYARFTHTYFWHYLVCMCRKHIFSGFMNNAKKSHAVSYIERNGQKHLISLSNLVNLRLESHMTRTAYVIYVQGAGRCLQRRIIWQSDKPADRQINSLPRRHRDLIVSLTETLVSHSIPTAMGQYLSSQKTSKYWTTFSLYF